MVSSEVNKSRLSTFAFGASFSEVPAASCDTAFTNRIAFCRSPFRATIYQLLIVGLVMTVCDF